MDIYNNFSLNDRISSLFLFLINFTLEGIDYS